MPTTTITVFSRSSCSTVPGGSSPPCCARPGVRKVARSQHICGALSARSADTGRESRSCSVATATTARPRCSIFAAPKAWTSFSASPATPPCGAGPRPSSSPPSPGSIRTAAPRSGARGVSRHRRILEPGRAHHHPRRVGPTGLRHLLHRHQPDQGGRQGALRKALLRPRPFRGRLAAFPSGIRSSVC